MTDLEMVKLCAKSMEIDVSERNGILLCGPFIGADGGSEFEQYDPLQYDGQAMALVKAHTLDVTWGMGEQRWRVGLWGFVEPDKDALSPRKPKQGLLCEVRGYDLNRCIVESVAHLQAQGKL